MRYRVVLARCICRLNIGILKVQAAGQRPKIWLVSRAWIVSCIQASLKTGNVLIGGDIVVSNILTRVLSKVCSLPVCAARL